MYAIPWIRNLFFGVIADDMYPQSFNKPTVTALDSLPSIKNIFAKNLAVSLNNIPLHMKIPHPNATRNNVKNHNDLWILDNPMILLNYIVNRNLFVLKTVLFSHSIFHLKI